MRDDLKNYSERPGFVILTNDEVVLLLCLLIAGVAVAELVRQAAAWFFA